MICYQIRQPLAEAKLRLKILSLDDKMFMDLNARVRTKVEPRIYRKILNGTPE